MEETHAELLSRISGGIHSHLIEADTEADMDAIEHALDKLGSLYNS
jgi:transcriptional regulator of NAD metabolism